MLRWLPIVLLAAHATAESATRTLAARYDAPACRSAMRRMLDPTGAFAGSRWAKTSRNWVQQDGALYNGTILYVRNQKVGSEMIMSSARHSPLGPQKPLDYAGRFPRGDVPSLSYATPAALPADFFVFSIVGEPGTVAAKAYLEISRRRTRPQKLEPTVEADGGLGAYRGIPCDAAGATRRFRTFLEELANGTDLGREAFHAWPQALKLAVVAPRGGRRFDALGRLERVGEDLAEVRAAVGAASPPGHDRHVLGRHHHTTAGLACARPDLGDGDVRRLLCDLYAADYACFGYAGCEAPPLAP